MPIEVGKTRYEVIAHVNDADYFRLEWSGQICQRLKYGFCRSFFSDDGTAVHSATKGGCTNYITQSSVDVTYSVKQLFDMGFKGFNQNIYHAFDVSRAVQVQICPNLVGQQIVSPTKFGKPSPLPRVSSLSLNSQQSLPSILSRTQCTL